MKPTNHSATRMSGDAPARPGPAPATGAGRVLIIDDEPQVLAVMERLVRSAGFDTVTARDAVGALRHLGDAAFEAVVSDICMPGMSGLDLLCEVRKHDMDVPVVFVTGMPTMETALTAMQHGALRYLQKPFNHDEFKQVVTKAVQLGRLAAIKRRAIEAQGLSHGIVSDLAGAAARLDDTLASIWMAFQPLVRCPDFSVFGYEALMRSRDTVLSHPGLVLAAAEQVERLPDLGRLVRRKVAAVVASSDVETVFLNLHPMDLKDPDLVDPASDLARVADRVVLEITERATLSGDREMSATLADLRRMGFRIAIDDLGAGYASLGSFVMLEPDVVKIDMGLVRGVHESPIKLRLVRSIVELCQDMGQLVVAEGVEVVAERDALVGLGCDLLQGFLFARPGPPFPTVQSQG